MAMLPNGESRLLIDGKLVAGNAGTFPTVNPTTEEVLALSLAGLSSRYPDLVVERRAERGYPSQVLTTVGSDARLIVVGTHGRGAIARFLLGWISQEVLQHLPTVTAVVR